MFHDGISSDDECRDGTRAERMLLLLLLLLDNELFLFVVQSETLDKEVGDQINNKQQKVESRKRTRNKRI